MRELIYIAVNGIGLGHARRSHRIGKVMKAAGYNVLFSTYEDSPAERFLKQENWRVLTVPELSWVPTLDGGIDRPRTALRVFQGAKIVSQHLSFEYSLLKTLKPKVVLSDMRLSPIMSAELLNIPRFFLSLFLSMRRAPKNKLKPYARLLAGFLERVAKRCDKIFFTDFPLPWTIYYYFLPAKTPSNMIFTGPIVDENIERIISSNDIETAKEQAKENLNLTRFDKVILFVPSGHRASQKFFLENFLSLFPCFKEMSRNKFVLIQIGSIGKIIRLRENVEILNWIPNKMDRILSEYFLASDIVIGHYGMNKVFDSLAAGAIFAGIVSNEHIEQQGLAKRITELKLGFIIQDFKIDIPQIIQIVSDNDEYYYRRIRAYNKLMKSYKPLETIRREIENVIS